MRGERERVHTTSSLAAQLRGPEGAWTTVAVEDDDSTAGVGEGPEEVSCCNGEERGEERERREERRDRTDESDVCTRWKPPDCATSEVCQSGCGVTAADILPYLHTGWCCCSEDSAH